MGPRQSQSKLIDPSERDMYTKVKDENIKCKLNNFK